MLSKSFPLTLSVISALHEAISTGSVFSRLSSQIRILSFTSRPTSPGSASSALFDKTNRVIFVQFPISRGIVDSLLFAASKFRTFSAKSPSASNSFVGISLALQSLRDTIPVVFQAFSRDAVADLDFDRTVGLADDGVLDTQPIASTSEVCSSACHVSYCWETNSREVRDCGAKMYVFITCSFYRMMTSLAYPSISLVKVASLRPISLLVVYAFSVRQPCTLLDRHP
jgi:hypothetical protein